MRAFQELSRALSVIDKWLKPDHLRLHAGEMTAQEMRSIIAVLKAVRSEIAMPAGSISMDEAAAENFGLTEDDL